MKVVSLGAGRLGRGRAVRRILFTVFNIGAQDLSRRSSKYYYVILANAYIQSRKAFARRVLSSAQHLQSTPDFQEIRVHLHALLNRFSLWHQYFSCRDYLLLTSRYPLLRR